MDILKCDKKHCYPIKTELIFLHSPFVDGLSAFLPPCLVYLRDEKGCVCSRFFDELIWLGLKKACLSLQESQASSGGGDEFT